MARDSWIDADSNPHLDAHVAQLEHFTKSMADGEIDANELETQENNLVAAMREVESVLDDAQHAKVTKLLAELTAYSVMRTLHELTAARVKSLKL
jgi:CBS-domain-containing membrane protein